MDILSAIIAVGSALAIGLLASVAPCALTSNIAALAYVGEKISRPVKTASAGLAYIAGRALTYTMIGLVILFLGREVIETFEGIQTIAWIVLGFLFILVGAVILDAIKLDLSIGDKLKSRYTGRLLEGGVFGAFGLGVVFSVAFCPYMAGMFFGLLIPLAFASGITGFALPTVFGLATGLPVLAFALFAAHGVSRAQEYLERIRRVEPYVRKLFGAGILLYGFYLIFSFIM